MTSALKIFTHLLAYWLKDDT